MDSHPPTGVSPVRSDEEMAWTALEVWLRRHVAGLSGDMSVAQFHGGHANLTYCVSFNERDLVVRRPPLGRIAPGAHDMAREFKVLTGLSRHFDQAPEAYALCEDDSVIGAPFIVMERCKGVVIRDSLPPEFKPSPELPRDVSFALVDAMVRLQSVDANLVGFGDSKRAERFVERQLEGWNGRWALASGGKTDTAFDRVFGSLVETRPETTRVSVVHNDLKLDNCVFDPRDPAQVEVILDWDMATIGDPLIEFGTLLGYWKQAGDDFDRAPTVGLDMSAFPSRAEMMERYELQGGQTDNLPWYEAFALWKHAVVLKQLHRRFATGESQDQRYAAFPDYIPALIAGASDLLEGFSRQTRRRWD
jgi:aminoglycoside phosphotransferase (APT) family kinase protein